ncbi:MAG: 3D domain-containing protein [Lentisphaerales bacterium]|nr:3D domain-containing protein [Lentisphaerales bacterium]
MSRSRLTRYVIALGLLMACLPGCQHVKKTKRSLSSYRFVDTTTERFTKRTELAAKLEEAKPSFQETVIQRNLQEKRIQAPVEYTESVRDGKKTYLTVTAYCPCATCCGWRINRHGNPVYNYGSQRGSRKKIGYTSTGTKADIGTIAADPRAIPYGTRLEIPGYGYGIVEDTGGALRGNHVDIFFHSHREAMRWGVKNIEVKLWPPAR